MNVRTMWFEAHLYVGITIGTVLFIVALSGAVLVFEDNIDRVLRSSLSYVEPADRWLPLQDLVAAVRTRYPAANSARSASPKSPTTSSFG